MLLRYLQLRDTKEAKRNALNEKILLCKQFLCTKNDPQQNSFTWQLICQQRNWKWLTDVSSSLLSHFHHCSGC